MDWRDDTTTNSTTIHRFISHGRYVHDDKGKELDVKSDILEYSTA